MKENRTFIKEKPKTILTTTLAIVILALSFCFVSSSLNINVVQNKPIFTYNESSNVDYNVSLKKNDYFDEDILPSGEQYITSIIDKVHIDYNYDFSATDQFVGTYSYRIYAKVSADYNVDPNTAKQVWSKEYDLVKKQEKKVDDKATFAIDEQVDVNYDTYNKIINDFKRDYMLAVNAKVDVIMDVNFNITYKDRKVKDSASLVTSIPLSEQTIEISEDYKANDQGDITQSSVIKRFNNVFVFILGIVFAILGIIILIKQWKKIIEEDKKQSQYIKKLKKYLHDYGDIIATSKEVPKTKGLNVIEVVKFEDMVNAQDDLRVPIIFCETKKNQEGKFFLISQDCIYCYTLSEEITKGGKHDNKKEDKE